MLKRHWGSAPNPGRKPCSLHPLSDLQQLEYALLNDAHARRMLKMIQTGAKRRRGLGTDPPDRAWGGSPKRLNLIWNLHCM